MELSFTGLFVRRARYQLIVGNEDGLIHALTLLLLKVISGHVKYNQTSCGHGYSDGLAGAIKSGNSEEELEDRSG